jgi:hypothetical protein
VTRVAVAKDKFARGLNGTARAVRDAYEVLDLEDALARVYATDAHLVTYVVAGAEYQPRINKTGLHMAPTMPVVEAFFCDVDNAAHAEWTDALRAAARAEEDALAILGTAGIYDTAHGRRIVQPIAEAIRADGVEPYLRRWLRDLEAAGLAVDWKCKDWTRHFRLPHVRRAGRNYRSPRVALERMRTIALTPIPASECAAPALTTRGAPRPVVSVDWTRDLPPTWEAKVARLANAVRAVESDWHTLFLTLAGALLARGVPPEHVPAICRAVSLATHADTRTGDREKSARSTVERKVAGFAVKGHAELRRRYPIVADALDELTASGANARMREHARAASNEPPPSPLAETTAALERAIQNAPDGVTSISAECGLGKTQAAIRVAVARANAALADKKRAPSQSKTVISVDKNSLAIQVAADVRKSGTPAKRLFGPLSLLREDGTPECRYHATAKPLVEGGQPLQLLFCEGRGGTRCPHYDSCRARQGFEGDEDARITIAPHALLAKSQAEAGTTGLLVIDEPPSLIESASFTEEDIAATLDARSMFAVQYGAAMAPALRAIRAWVVGASDLERVVPLKDAVREAANTVSPLDVAVACVAARVSRSGDHAADIVACVAESMGPSPRSPAPPIQNSYVHRARHDRGIAEKLGAASKVLKAVHFALTTDERVDARVEESGKTRTLVLSHARVDLAKAVKREGATVLLDASADLHAPALAKIVGYVPPFHRFTAQDGAPIARTLLQTGAATRRSWFVNKRLVIDSGIVTQLERVLAWAAEDPMTKTLGLVTFRPLAIALAITMAGEPVPDSARATWASIGQRPEELDAVRTALARALARWPGTLKVGHYGAVRGLDTMKDVDAMATLGDPWPHIPSVQHDVGFLGLEEPWERRLTGLARAELEQAHGRLRVVHRTRPARALHVGNVLPGGSGWREGQVTYRKLVGGRPRTEVTMSREEVRAAVGALGSISAAAREVGCSPMAMGRYFSGERAVPPALAIELRRLTAPTNHSEEAAAQ